MSRRNRGRYKPQRRKKLEVEEQPFCYKCGDLPKGTPTFFDGYTFWCEKCANEHKWIYQEA